MSSSTAFNIDVSQDVLDAACVAVGLDSINANLIRFGQNAIYKLAEVPIIARVSRTADIEDVANEVRVAQWLADAKFPTTRLAHLSVPQPIVSSGRATTFWDYVDEEDGDPTYADLARLLRQFHDLVQPTDLDLPHFNPFREMPARFAAAPASVPRDAVEFLARRVDEVQEAFRGTRFDLPPGPIHADAHLGNLLRGRDGTVLLIDLEYVCHGPREWDIALPAIHRYAFDWIDDSEYRRFTKAYGYDVSNDPCFQVLREIRELNMTVWLMQNVEISDEIRAEFDHRVATIRDPNLPRHWRRF